MPRIEPGPAHTHRHAASSPLWCRNRHAYPHEPTCQNPKLNL